MEINNSFYGELGEAWYQAKEDPIALLRAEARFRNEWIEAALEPSFHGMRVLDLGCGGGFLSNFLAQKGFDVTAVDASLGALEVARRHDKTGSVDYQQAHAERLPFRNEEFDAVCAMDFLEHVADPAACIREASRVLVPGGSFLFYTFNRNFLSYLIAIKGVEWVLKSTPENMHLLKNFIKPRELRHYCLEAGLIVEQLRGVRPEIWSRAFARLVFRGRVEDDFKFKWTRSLALAYLGTAVKC